MLLKELIVDTTDPIMFFFATFISLSDPART
jgi:hypothetical protein